MAAKDRKVGPCTPPCYGGEFLSSLSPIAVQRLVHLRQRRALRRHDLLLLHGGDQCKRRRLLPLDAEGPLLEDVRVPARRGTGMTDQLASLD